MHFGYTKVGLEKMQALKSLLLDDIDSALKYSEFRGIDRLAADSRSKASQSFQSLPNREAHHVNRIRAWNK